MSSSTILWIVTWKVGCTWMCYCVCVPVHPGCVPTPCLECVHASVDEFMSTWLSIPAPSPCVYVWWKLMGTPVCVSMFVSQVSPCFCCHTLFRMCACNSTWYLCPPYSPYYAPTPYGIVTLKVGWPCVLTVCVSQLPCLCSDTLFRMCTCISTCNLCAPDWPGLVQIPYA